MSKLTWPEGRCSVIVLPSGDDGRRLLELAGQWTSAWLLGAAFWVETEQIPLVDSDTPPDVKAWVLGRDENDQPARRQVDLFWALGAQSFDDVRLLACRVAQEPESQRVTTTAIDALAEYLDRSRPAVPQGVETSHIGTKLRKYNLIFGATNDKDVQRSVLSASWNANIIAAAEDRPTGLSFDAFVVHNHRYDGFVLAHIATAAGLWVGLNQSAADLQDHYQEQGAVLQRVSVRAIASDTLAGALATAAIDRANDPDAESSLGRVAGQNVSAVSLMEQEAVRADLVTYLLDGLPRAEGEEPVDFRFHPFEGKSDSHEDSRGLWAKIALRAQDAYEGLLHLPKLVKVVLERRIDAGDEAERPSVCDALPPRLDPPAGHFPPKMPGIAKEDVPRTSPELWRFVRETFSAAIDSPPHIASPKALVSENGVRLVFSSTDKVFPRVDDIWSSHEFADVTTAELIDVDWLDAVAAITNAESLDLRASALAPALNEAQVELQTTSDAVTGAERDLANAKHQHLRAEKELAEDLEHAVRVHVEHPHGMPIEVVGPSRLDSLLSDESVREQALADVGVSDLPATNVLGAGMTVAAEVDPVPIKNGSLVRKLEESDQGGDKNA